MNVRRSIDRSGRIGTQSNVVQERNFLSERSFQRMVAIERVRTQRSGKPILLMLLDVGDNPSKNDNSILNIAAAALASSTRETDLVGWYETDKIIGVLFTEIAVDDRSLLLSTMLARVSDTLREHLRVQQFRKLSTSFHYFPEDVDEQIAERRERRASIPAASLISAEEDAAVRPRTA